MTVQLLLLSLLLLLSVCHAQQLLRLPSKSECKRLVEENIEHCNNLDDVKHYCAQACHIQLQRKRLVPFGYTDAKTFHQLSAKDIDGNDVDFSQFKGKVVLVTNVASYCGSTKSHYKQLNALYKKFHHTKKHDFEILAFPCNQFGGQEPDDPETIKDFCENEKHVKFRIMSKVNVNGGDDVHDVFKFLKRKVGPSRIQWNFGTYFLVGKAGQLESYSGGVMPRDLESHIASALRGQMIGSSS